MRDAGSEKETTNFMFAEDTSADISNKVVSILFTYRQNCNTRKHLDLPFLLAELHCGMLSSCAVEAWQQKAKSQ